MEFTPKAYQISVLESIEIYFRNCCDEGDADTSFYKTTKDLWGKGIQYQSIEGFPTEMPYFCLRVPTGGGKTWLAAKSIRLINNYLLHSEYSVILWLVPSKVIREQTLKALKDRSHPYYAAIREVGSITVMDLDEAKNMTRATLETSTTIIVSTVQAFRRDDTDFLKVYESSGALMHHFDDIKSEQRKTLLDEDGILPYSLANVLRLHRPFLIIDEAHNNRTPLSFKTFADFRPSGIMELTATPDTETTPSNVLHSVYAAELKAEEMIKLPIRLETEPNWQQCLADAIATRGELQVLAEKEARKGESYLRPLVLIQAEPRRTGVETHDVDHVRNELIENHRITEDELVVATGEEKGLEKIDNKYEKGILSPDCPVKYVITQKALAEGWDCPFAYILVSMAELRSATAVEQLLGRILRQPEASHRESTQLNQSYAFVVSRDFQATANALRDRMVEGAGFEKKEAAEFVTASSPKQRPFDLEGRSHVVIKPVTIELSEKPDLKKVDKLVRNKVKWDNKKKTLTISKPLSHEDTEELKSSVTSRSTKKAIENAGEISRTEAIEFFITPAEDGKEFSVPQIALIIQGELELFDDPEVLDYPWDLSSFDANPTKENLERINATDKVADGGEIDIDDETGRVITRFIADLQRDLGLAYQPENWTNTKLAAWLCKNLPVESVTHVSKQAFVAKWLGELLDKDAFDLGRVNRQKFVIRILLEQKIKELRNSAIEITYQETLFGEGNDERVVVSSDYVFTFNPYAYAPSNDYDGRFGQYVFRHHYYNRIGDFDSGEELECAVWLDQQAEKGHIEFWVRNLVRKEGCSFFFQKADGKFYPDFVCKLPSNVILVVEYKSARDWDTPKVKADRLIGELWEEMSDNQCRFIMVKNKRWEAVESKFDS